MKETDIGLENIEEIEKDGDGMKDIGQVNNDDNRIENKLKRSRTELDIKNTRYCLPVATNVRKIVKITQMKSNGL